MNRRRTHANRRQGSHWLALWGAAVSLLVGWASAQEISGTGEILAGWSARGGMPVAGAEQSFTLPASAEILQSHSAQSVTVRLVTRPYFSASSEGGPFLEVGPAALTFLRREDGGAMLLLGDEPLPLPFTIGLGVDGRSIRSLDFTLAYDRPAQTATFTIDGNSYSLQANAEGDLIAVVLSAGAESPWIVSSVSVTVSGQSEGGEGGGGLVGGLDGSAEGGGGRIAKVSDRAAYAAERKAATDEALAHFRAGDYELGEKALLGTNRHPVGTVGWYIEAAGRLSQAALMLRQLYEHKGAIVLARRAVELLRESRTVTAGADTRGRVIALEVAGFVQEELLRDPAAARMEFEEARRLDPLSGRARLALERLDEAAAKSHRLTGSH